MWYEPQIEKLAEPGYGRTKRIRVWENGDFENVCTIVTINPNSFRSWNLVLSYLTNILHPHFGAVRELVFLKDRSKVNCFKDLENNGKYIAIGRQPLKYKKNGYKTHSDFSLQHHPPSKNVKKYYTPKPSKLLLAQQKWRRILTFFFVSGRVCQKPVKVVFTPEDFDMWEVTSEFLSKILDIPDGMQYICTIHGDIVESPYALQTGCIYVAVPFNDKFIEMDYEVRFEEWDASKRWDKQMVSDLKSERKNNGFENGDGLCCYQKKDCCYELKDGVSTRSHSPTPSTRMPDEISIGARSIRSQSPTPSKKMADDISLGSKFSGRSTCSQFSTTPKKTPADDVSTGGRSRSQSPTPSKNMGDDISLGSKFSAGISTRSQLSTSSKKLPGNNISTGGRNTCLPPSELSWRMTPDEVSIKGRYPSPALSWMMPADDVPIGGRNPSPAPSWMMPADDVPIGGRSPSPAPSWMMPADDVPIGGVCTCSPSPAPSASSKLSAVVCAEEKSTTTWSRSPTPSKKMPEDVSTGGKSTSTRLPSRAPSRETLVDAATRGVCACQPSLAPPAKMLEDVSVGGQSTSIRSPSPTPPRKMPVNVCTGGGCTYSLSPALSTKMPEVVSIGGQNTSIRSPSPTPSRKMPVNAATRGGSTYSLSPAVSTKMPERVSIRGKSISIRSPSPSPSRKMPEDVSIGGKSISIRSPSPSPSRKMPEDVYIGGKSISTRSPSPTPSKNMPEDVSKRGACACQPSLAPPTKMLEDISVGGISRSTRSRSPTPSRKMPADAAIEGETDYNSSYADSLEGNEEDKYVKNDFEIEETSPSIGTSNQHRVEDYRSIKSEALSISPTPSARSNISKKKEQIVCGFPSVGRPCDCSLDVDIEKGNIDAASLVEKLSQLSYKADSAVNSKGTMKSYTKQQTNPTNGSYTVIDCSKKGPICLPKLHPSKEQFTWIDPRLIKKDEKSFNTDAHIDFLEVSDCDADIIYDITLTFDKDCIKLTSIDLDATSDAENLAKNKKLTPLDENEEITSCSSKVCYGSSMVNTDGTDEMKKSCNTFVASSALSKNTAPTTKLNTKVEITKNMPENNITNASPKLMAASLSYCLSECCKRVNLDISHPGLNVSRLNEAPPPGCDRQTCEIISDKNKELVGKSASSILESSTTGDLGSVTVLSETCTCGKNEKSVPIQNTSSSNINEPEQDISDMCSNCSCVTSISSSEGKI